MPFLSLDSPREPARLLLMGNSGAGKTGALLSLAAAGYTLHILDTDRKAADLFRSLTSDPEILSRIDIEQVIERLEARRVPGEGRRARIKGEPKAFERCFEIIDAWLKEGFDKQHIVVLDTFTALSKYAGSVAARINQRDVPIFQDYPAAFAMLRPFLEMITAFEAGSLETFQCHVIVNAHLNYYEVKQKTGEKITVGRVKVDETQTIDTLVYPKSIGQGLSPEIPTFFNAMLYVAQRSTNDAKRVIYTVPEGLVPVKTPVQGLPRTLPVESGLATYFSLLDKPSK